MYIPTRVSSLSRLYLPAISSTLIPRNSMEFRAFPLHSTTTNQAMFLGKLVLHRQL